MPDLTLKERCNNRLVGLKAARKGFEPEAKDIAAFGQPARSRFLSTSTNKGPGVSRQYNKNMNNSHGVFAFQTLQGGMTSGLSSQSRPWMTLGSFDERFDEHAEVRAYFSDVEKRTYAFLAATNFYSAVKTGYLELGLFGTEACIATEHPRLGMVCHQLTFGEYWLGIGTSMMPEALYREVPMTVKQTVDTFKDQKGMLDPTILRLYDNSNYDSIITFYHAIETNDDQIPGRLDFNGKPWRSVYWADGDSNKDHLFQRQGFEEQPFWAPRWDTTGNDVWGQGPGHTALPDLRELQLQAKRKAEATDMAIWPEKVVSGKIKLKNQPKAVTSVAAADVDLNKMVMIPHRVDFNTIQIIAEDMDKTKQSIDQATYADLFMAITNMQGVQPRNVEEIAARNEEKLTQLGPVIERVNTEKLSPALDRTIAIMQRRGLLPPAPDVLRDAPDIKFEFISILTQMQRMVGLGQIERAVGFVGNAVSLFPEIRHKIDAMEMVDEYWSRAGAPAKILRPTDDAQKDADAEAQQQQMAQSAEMAGKAAPAAKAAVDASKEAAAQQGGGGGGGLTPAAVQAAALLAQSPNAAPPAVEDLVPVVPR